MSERVSKRSGVPSYRENGHYRFAGRNTNKPGRFVQNKTWRRTIPPKNESINKHKAHAIRSSNAKRNSSQICKYWINGNCTHRDRCWNLHSLFQGDGFSVLTKLHQHKKIVTGITLPDGSNRLFSSSTDGTLRVWDCHAGQCVNTINLGDEGLIRMNGMKDAKGKPILFCSSNNHSVRLYEMPSFAPRGRLFSKQEIRVIEEGPEGLFFTGDSTGLLTVWKWLPESSEPMTISS